tara:strand:- start:272 stop:508 length:237 start_codon:yes stop_codon:yes gene_type:complete
MSDKYFIDLIRSVALNNRKDVSKRICTVNEAMHILGFSSKSGFYRLLAQDACLVRPSSLQGKYNLKTVNDEADRLNSI